jgi:purine-cytosine permease-like protein
MLLEIFLAIYGQENFLLIYTNFITVLLYVLGDNACPRHRRPAVDKGLAERQGTEYAAVKHHRIGGGDPLLIYTNFITVLLYVLVPWTAINLVDYYLVAHGEYHVEL